MRISRFILTVVSGLLLFICGVVLIGSYHWLPGITYVDDDMLNVGCYRGKIVIAREVNPIGPLHVPESDRPRLTDNHSAIASDLDAIRKGVGAGNRVLVIPLWSIVLILSVLPIHDFLWYPMVVIRRRRKNKCLSCGYLLTGLPTSHCCPECGTKDPHKAGARRASRHLIISGAYVLIIALVGGVAWGGLERPPAVPYYPWPDYITFEAGTLLRPQAESETSLAIPFKANLQPRAYSPLEDMRWPEKPTQALDQPPKRETLLLKMECERSPLMASEPVPYHRTNTIPENERGADTVSGTLGVGPQGDRPLLSILRAVRVGPRFEGTADWRRGDNGVWILDVKTGHRRGVPSIEWDPRLWDKRGKWMPADTVDADY